MKEDNLSFIKVRKINSHINCLYELLDNKVGSISHQRMPSISEHEKFVKNHPYRAWYLIKIHACCIGAFYITTSNTVGINLLRGYESYAYSTLNYVLANFKPLKAIPSVRPGNFHINTSPRNNNMQNILRRYGAEMVQVTFSLR